MSSNKNLYQYKDPKTGKVNLVKVSPGKSGHPHIALVPGKKPKVLHLPKKTTKKGTQAKGSGVKASNVMFGISGLAATGAFILPLTPFTGALAGVSTAVGSILKIFGLGNQPSYGKGRKKKTNP